MFTLIGYNEAVDEVNVFKNLKGAGDQHVRVVDDKVYIPDFNKLIFSFARGINLARGRLESPSLRRLSYLYINPIDNEAVTATHPSPVAMYQGESPLPLTINEGLEAKAMSQGVVATFYTIGVALADAPVRPVAGEIWTVRATATITAEVSMWKNGEIEFDETLPVGRYQVVGAECWGEVGHAFRLVPVGSMYRPGGLCLSNLQVADPPWMRKGGLGVWCEFNTLTPPSLDVLCSTAGAYQFVVHLDLIKIA